MDDISFYLDIWDSNEHEKRGIKSISPICIVQSYPAAKKMDHFYPFFLWLAVGYPTALLQNSLCLLSDYLVLLFPPYGSEQEWSRYSGGYSNVLLVDWIEILWHFDPVDWKGKEVSDLLHSVDPSFSELVEIITNHVDQYFNINKTKVS